MTVFIDFLLFAGILALIILFIQQLRNRINHLFHAPALENRLFLQGMIYGISIGVYALFLLLLPILLGFVFGFIDPSGAGGLVFAQIIVASIAAFPWIFLLIEKFPILVHAEGTSTLLLLAILCVIFNAFLLGVIKGLLNLYQAKRILRK